VADADDPWTKLRRDGDRSAPISASHAAEGIERDVARGACPDSREIRVVADPTDRHGVSNIVPPGASRLVEALHVVDRNSPVATGCILNGRPGDAVGARHG